MSGIDLLLAKSLSSRIKKELDSEIEKKLKLRLFKKYGLSVRQSMEDFDKFDRILKEFLKSDSQKFEKKCLAEIITVDKSTRESLELTILDKSLAEQFLDLLGDKESRKIIEQTSKKPLLISEILKICRLSKTSGYRKINALIRNGFLISTGHELTATKRAVKKYTMFCNKINIEVEKDKHAIKVIIPKKIFQSGSIIQIIEN